MTQKVSVLGDVCQEGMKEMYADLVQLLVVAATRLREEVSQLSCVEHTVHVCWHVHMQVSMLEEDVLVGQTRRKKGSSGIKKTQVDLEVAVRDTQLACLMASGQGTICQLTIVTSLW